MSRALLAAALLLLLAVPVVADDMAALRQQVLDLCQAEKYREAIPVAEKLLKLREQALGAEDPKTADSCNDLATLYLLTGAPDQAEPMYLRALRIREKALGPNHADTATTLTGLANLYERSGAYARAVPLYERAVGIWEKSLGPRHPEVVDLVEKWAQASANLGQYLHARQLWQRALACRQTAECLQGLGQVCVRLGDFAAAEEALKKAVALREKTLGSEAMETLDSLNDLAGLYDAMGDYRRAAPLLERTVETARRKFGAAHYNTAQCMTNLAMLYARSQDYARALPLLLQAVEATETALGPSSAELATDLNDLGLVYMARGDYEKAEAPLLRALAMQEKVLGKSHPDTATVLSSLGAMYYARGNDADATLCDERALRILEHALGPDSVEVAKSLTDLGAIYLRSKRYPKALDPYQRALRITEQALGPKHPDSASRINNLAAVYDAMGEYGEAAALYQRALRVYTDALGTRHPLSLTTLNNLAVMQIELKQPAHTVDLALRANRMGEEALRNLLAYSSEQERLAFQRMARTQNNPYTLLAALGRSADLAETVLRRKGIVLDSLLEDRLLAQASQDPKLQAAVTEVITARERLTRIMWSESASARQEEEAGLKLRIEAAETELARHVSALGGSRRALSVTVPQVQARLTAAETLVEFLWYPRYMGKRRLEYHYGAVVIPPHGNPSWVPLGDAVAIEQLVRVYQKSMRHGGGGSHKRLEASCHANLQALYQHLWEPLERALPPSTKTVVLSPDGQISFVSFATLLTPRDEFLAEKYSIRYVSSGRDLLRDVTPSPSRQAVFFGNPDFSVPVEAETHARPSTRGAEVVTELRGVSFAPLPGTEAEVGHLAAFARQVGWDVTVRQHDDATKANLFTLTAPHLLHLATHGFFLPDTDEDIAMLGKRAADGGTLLRLSKVLPDPMLRSGVALAGAQTTIDLWKRGQFGAEDKNGLLTASEVGGLKLGGTWLVTLSACETGAGEAHAGEGVMGLRRGFVQAGTQNLLMTLWPIADKETAEFMQDFYRGAQQAPAPRALAQVQRDWLVRLRQVRGLVDAANLAGPFIMTSQGTE